MTADPGAILEGLFWSNLRVVVLLAGVWLAVVAIRSRDGAFRHDIWLTAIAACLLLPVLSAKLPAIALPWLPLDEPATGEYSLPAEGGSHDSGVVAMAESGATPESSFYVFDSAASVLTSLGAVLLMIWAAGAVISIGWFGVGVIRVVGSESAMRQHANARVVELANELGATVGLRRRVRLLECARSSSPHTWGVIRPRIVLPAASRNWSSDQLRNVLLHELCHVKRLDWLRLCLMRIVASVYWFNPMIWLAVRECRYEAERACDEFVVRAGGESTDYAEQLLDLMAMGQRTGDIGIALGDGCFAKRVRSILASDNEVHAMSKSGRHIAAGVTVLGAAVLAACQVTQGQPADGQPAGTQDVAMQSEELVEVRAREEAERAAALARREAEVAVARQREEAEIVTALQREEAERRSALARQAAEEAELLARREAELARDRTEQAERLADLERRHFELQQEHQALLERYTEDHPEVVSVVARLRESEQLLAEAGARFGQLNALAARGRDAERRAIREREVMVQLQEQELRIRDLERALERSSLRLEERERELIVLQEQLNEQNQAQ